MDTQMALFDKPTNICTNYHGSTTEAVLVQGVEGGKLQGQFFGIQKALRHEPQHNGTTLESVGELMNTKEFSCQHMHHMRLRSFAKYDIWIKREIHQPNMKPVCDFCCFCLTHHFWRHRLRPNRGENIKGECVMITFRPGVKPCYSPKV